MPTYSKFISRRDFLKTGIAGGAIVATLPAWNMFAKDLPEENFYVNPSCELSKEALEELLSIALKKGGEFAEVYVEYSVINRIVLDEDKIHSATRGLDMGVGIRVLQGEKTGYAHSDDLDMDTLKKTAEVAGMIAAGSPLNKVNQLNKSAIPSYYQVKTVPDLVVPKKKSGLLLKANQVARAYDKNITQVNARYQDLNKKILIANSEGRWVDDHQTITRLLVLANAMDDKKRRSRGYDYRGGMLGFEHYDLNVAEKIAKEAARIAVAMLPAEDAPAGEYPIVMAKGECGTFFHEAIGHSLEGDSIRKKTSCFWDKKGEMIAAPIVSLEDNGTIPGKRGSINVDDEGTASQNTLLIDNGKCVNFLYDKLNAKLMNVQSTGNGRRESYQHFPIPRMTNTYLMAGKDDPEDIVKSVKKGLYISKIGGGNVSSTTGRFVFSVPEGYMIEDGKVTKPLKGIQLMGNGQDILKDIVMVGPDLEIAGGGTCGKSGQSKPVTDGNPTLKVSKITIGGSKA